MGGRSSVLNCWICVKCVGLVSVFDAKVVGYGNRLMRWYCCRSLLVFVVVVRGCCGGRKKEAVWVLSFQNRCSPESVLCCWLVSGQSKSSRHEHLVS